MLGPNLEDEIEHGKAFLYIDHCLLVKFNQECAFIFNRFAAPFSHFCLNSHTLEKGFLIYLPTSDIPTFFHGTL